jgi:hypothetical protein
VAFSGGWKKDSEMRTAVINGDIPVFHVGENEPKKIDLPLLLVSGVFLVMLVAIVGLAFVPRNADAIPSFARQTGQPCASCHAGFPQLTPFGRRFKLGGYTMGGGLSNTEAPPLSAMLIPAFTQTRVRQDSLPLSDNFWPVGHTNGNAVLEQASLFYGGQVYGNLGAFVQGTWSQAGQRVVLDNTDIRYADTIQLGDLDVLYGIDVNNNPTVQDVWNTVPAWSYPFVSPSLAPAYSPPGTMIEGAFASRTAGTGAYLFLQDLVYVEASAYHNLSKGQLNATGQSCNNNSDYATWMQDIASTIYSPSFYTAPCYSASLSGVAPYWRVAIEPTWGDHSLMIGAFGWYPQVLPGRMMGYGTDAYKDIGFDAQYQWISDPHNVTLRFSRISEQQTLNSTYWQGVINGSGISPYPTGIGGSTSLYNNLTSLKASGQYMYDQTYAATIGYFDVRGSHDDLLYGNVYTNPVGPSSYATPTGRGLTFELNYMPFNKGGPKEYPWANMKVGLQYTTYLKMYGGTTNFDGLGPYFNGSNWRYHNASDNNTLFLYNWIAF